MRCISFAHYARTLLVLLVCSLLPAGILFPQNVLAQTHTSNDNGCTVTPVSTTAKRPDKNSLLLVLLDRSGSLIDPPDPTDPYQLSTSVTRALTDLWPGKMAVITFPKVNPLVRDQVRTSSIADLTDSTQLSMLKNSIPEADPNGNTPLGLAMESALKLLPASIPDGSRAILITDGAPNTSTDPNGTQEVQHIQQDLLPQFQKLGFPISTFGLKVDRGSSEDSFLQTIASISGGEHTSVESAGQLAQSVMQLYANWSGQQFYCASQDSNGNYGVTLNEFTKQASIIAFRSNASYAINVHDPKGNSLVPGVGVTQSLDLHYQLDKLDVTPPVLAGTYNVSISHDPGAQVYWLVNSRLQVHITSPTSNSAPGRVHIVAALYDDGKTFQPHAGAILQAQLAFTDNHVTVFSEVDLAQQGNDDAFRADSPSYGVGTLKIQIIAKYEEIPIQSDEQRIEIQLPWYQNPMLIIPIVLALLILLASAIILLIWRGKPDPHGMLINEQNSHSQLQLGSHRSFIDLLRKKSNISMSELSRHPEGITVLGSLIEEPLTFVFTKTQEEVILRQTGAAGRISVVNKLGDTTTFSATQKEIRLHHQDQICRNSIAIVSIRL